MNPSIQFCPNLDCFDRGQDEGSNIGIHSHEEKRYICHRCGKTFAARTGTIFYRRRYADKFISEMVSLLGHGCPPQAIVATYKVDERTLSAWDQASGEHCHKVHDVFIPKGQLDLGQVQADELRVKIQAGILWLASAIAVSTRLWLGGVVSQSRDKHLVLALAQIVKNCALFRPLLICFDGFKAYISAFQRAFRTPLADGRVGRPPLIAWPNIALGRVVKRYAKSLVAAVDRELVQGSSALAQSLLLSSQGGGVLNTSFVERLNATFRARLACLARRTRQLVRKAETLETGIYLTGSVYNFCCYHKSLRLKLYVTGERESHRWVKRTPAMAAGLTDHCWSVLELLSFKIAPPPYVPPKRRGRPPKAVSVP
jgi:transposase-like protein|tara:strand:+ start:193 stop:1302 length:1110 start_codon:yes stop_codon:yes gene_type:complete